MFESNRTYFLFFYKMITFNLLKRCLTYNFHPKQLSTTIYPTSWASRWMSSSTGQRDDDAELDELDDEDYLGDVFDLNRKSLHHRNVVVIMPRQFFGKDMQDFDRAQLLLEETETLVKSIPNWNVVSSDLISTSKLRSKQVLGKTNLAKLKSKVHASNANAVVFAFENLHPVQHNFLQHYLDVETYDRFTLILKVFKERASTKVAKLQLKLAELSYVKSNLHDLSETQFNDFPVIKRYGSNYIETKKLYIHQQQSRIASFLEKNHKDHNLRNVRRKVAEIPTVAVIGYTNSGKTSLIKALTGDRNLVPEDKLFATLDVSSHMTQLSSSFKMILIDTIGFITAIPTLLIHSFKSTLSEISNANLLVHVIDASHPDRELQIKTVHKTLQEIQVPDKLVQSMVNVYNKIDKTDDQALAEPGESDLLISATNGTGLNKLREVVQSQLVSNTDRQTLVIRVPNGGEEFQWMYKEATVLECLPDVDANFIRIKVIITQAKLAKFLSTFSPQQEEGA